MEQRYQTWIDSYIRADFMSDKMSCIVLRGQWCDTVTNVHAPRIKVMSQKTVT